jgi:hypothetical protein
MRPKGWSGKVGSTRPNRPQDYVPIGVANDCVKMWLYWQEWKIKSCSGCNRNSFGASYEDGALPGGIVLQPRIARLGRFGQVRQNDYLTGLELLKACPHQKFPGLPNSHLDWLHPTCIPRPCKVARICLCTRKPSAICMVLQMQLRKPQPHLRLPSHIITRDFLTVFASTKQVPP